jgi:flagellin
VSLTILNNVASLTAENGLALTSANLQRSIQQLSTGLKINSGADDAAGLSIANGLQANIAALTQSTQNATDGIGLLQTGDGALSQVTAMLNRAITLATEASNSVIDPTQATVLNAEFQSILTEINSVGSATTFNGQQVFTGNDVTPFLSDGTAGNNLPSGANMSIGTLTTDALGLGDVSTPATNATNTLTLTANVADGGTVQINSQTYTFRTTASSNGEVQIGADAKATLSNLVAAIAGNTLNTANADVTASVSGAGNNASITLTAKTSGADGNLISTNSSLTAAAGTTATGTWSNGGRLGGGTNGSYAQSQLSLSGNVVDGDTLQIGSTTYTFRTAASATGDVQIGNDAAASLSNLAQAISGDNHNSANASVSASASGTDMTLTAKSAGTSGNSLVASGTLAGAASITPDGTFATSGTPGFLGGGAGSTAAYLHLGYPSAPTNGSWVEFAGVTYTFVNTITGNNQVLIGADQYSAISHLVEAVNGDATGKANGDYSSNITADPSITATYTDEGGSGDGFIFATAIIPGASGNNLTYADSAGANLNFQAGSGSPSSAQLTLSNNPAAGESVNIGHTTYIFTSGASTGNHVHLGGTAADTLTNLATAINGNASDTQGKRI